MNEQVTEQQLQEIASSFRYPPTPDLAGEVRRSHLTEASGARLFRPAWAALVLLLLIIALLAVPTVRAAVFDFLQIGAIRILPVEATATPELTAPNTVPAEVDSVIQAQNGLASQNMANPSHTLLDIAGVTTWEAAQTNARFPLRLPSYPAALGLPDQVYEQRLPDWDEGVPVIILVWRERERPDEMMLALYQIAHPSYGLKIASANAVSETKVNGKLAYWIRDPHRLQLVTGAVEERFIVAGNVLIWVDGEITYRLEGSPNVEEGIRIAESLYVP